MLSSAAAACDHGGGPALGWGALPTSGAGAGLWQLAGSAGHHVGWAGPLPPLRVSWSAGESTCEPVSADKDQLTPTHPVARDSTLLTPTPPPKIPYYTPCTIGHRERRVPMALSSFCAKALDKILG